MAEPFDTLMQVQEHDTALDQLRRRKESLPDRIELADLVRRRADLDRSVAELQARVDDLADRQGRLEQQIAATAKRRHEIEQRMESGAVSASRDLQAMDHEVHQLAQRQSRLEEEELLLLEEQEPLDTQLGNDRAALDTIAAEADRLTAAIVESETALDAAIAAEATVRNGLAPDLPADLAQRYELLRSRLGGVGAARLVGDRCDGCHLTLPSVEVERIRHLPPEEFATCPQCDRILVH